MYYIGIDLGTSSVKLLMTDENGKIVKTVSRAYPISFPNPGWSEQNPEDWWVQTADGLREMTSAVDAHEIAGISFGGQMHGLVILDKNDRVIRPAILWNDGRTGIETDYLNEAIGREKVFSYTGNIAFAGFTAPKLLWLQKHEPQNFEKISKIMLPKDYIAYRLTGIFATDVSDASGTLLFDVKNRCWSGEMLKICGIRYEQLAEVYESSEVIGHISAAAAGITGLSEKCLVAAGAGDNAAAAIGTGTIGEGGCNISLGTSGTIFISGKSFKADSDFGLHSFCHADGGYHLMGCMLSAASCNQWWSGNILETSDYAREQASITRLGENHIFFLPYLMGERSPHNNPKARGTFIGMTMDTSRSDMTQAVMEGVIFGLRDSFEIAKRLGLKPERTKICGGGAKSLLWRQMTANILGIPVEVPEYEEGPAMGGAMLAAVACHAFKSVEEAAEKIVKIAEIIEPDSSLVMKYEEKYRQFAEIYPALRNIFKII